MHGIISQKKHIKCCFNCSLIQLNSIHNYIPRLSKGNYRRINSCNAQKLRSATRKSELFTYRRNELSVPWAQHAVQQQTDHQFRTTRSSNLLTHLRVCVTLCQRISVVKLQKGWLVTFCVKNNSNALTLWKGPQCCNIGTGECHVYVTIMSIMIMIIMIIMKDTAVVNLSIRNNRILFCMILQCCFQICHDCDNFFLCVSIAKSKFKLFIASPTKKGHHYEVIILRIVNHHGKILI